MKSGEDHPPIHTLTVEVLDRYRALRLGEKVGPGTINREMATLKHALSKAVEWKLLRKTAREELTAIRKYQEPDGRLRYLSGQPEADRLLQACNDSLCPRSLDGNPHRHAERRATGPYLGLRGYDAWIYPLEADEEWEARALPFNETLWSLFSGLRTRPDLPWVFHDAAGHRWNDIRHPFDAACDGAGLSDFHFHDLRHTFASWLMMRGVPLATVSNLLGHTSPTDDASLCPFISQAPHLSGSGVDPHLDSSLDSYLTIQPKQTPEGLLVGVQKDGVKTPQLIDSIGEERVGAEAGS